MSETVAGASNMSPADDILSMSAGDMGKGAHMRAGNPSDSVHSIIKSCLQYPIGTVRSRRYMQGFKPK